MSDHRIRDALREDLPFLRQMLAEAVCWQAGVHQPVDEILSPPELAKLLQRFAERDGDFGVIATSGDRGVRDRPVGAAWARLWSDADHSYGYVDALTPELGIAVVPQWRSRGLGGELLAALRRSAIERNLTGLSLSVQSANPARSLYVAHGFRTIAREGGAETMLLELPS